MNKRLFLYQVCLFCALAAMASELSAKELEFSINPTPLNGAYLLDDECSFLKTITIRHKGGACDYFITFSSGQSEQYDPRSAQNGAAALQYQIYDSMTNRNILKDLKANPASANVLTGSFPSSANTWISQTVVYAVHLLPGQLPPAGTYTDTIVMELHTGIPPGNGKPKDSASFGLFLTMAPAMDVFLVQRGFPLSMADSSFSMNFGILAEGKNKTADLIVRSNRRSSITMASKNGGTFNNNDAGDAGRVPYILTVNGAALSFSPGVPHALESNIPATAPMGRRYSISVTSGNPEAAMEGEYSDVITIQASAP